jgi:hypothetical protein
MARQPRPWKKIAFRILKESAIPAIGAVGWGLFAGLSKHSLVDGLSGGSIAFMFLLALQGQVLRISRNVRDDDRAEQYLGHFATIQEGISELRRARSEVAGSNPEPAAPLVPTIQLGNEGGFGHHGAGVELWRNDFDSAEFALRNGDARAAAVMAALGFERALASFSGDPHRPNTPRKVIETLPFLEDEDRGALTTLLRIRNNLVHSIGDPPSIDQARQLVGDFRDAIDMVLVQGSGF